MLCVLPAFAFGLRELIHMADFLFGAAHAADETSKATVTDVSRPYFPNYFNKSSSSQDNNADLLRTICSF